MSVLHGSITDISQTINKTKSNNIIPFIEIESSDANVTLENVILPCEIELSIGDICSVSYFKKNKFIFICSIAINGGNVNKTVTYAADQMFKSAFHSFAGIVFLYAGLLILFPSLIASNYFSSFQLIATVGLLCWPFLKYSEIKGRILKSQSEFDSIVIPQKD